MEAAISPPKRAGSRSASMPAPPPKHVYLEKKFHVGSANSFKVNYTLAEKFFHNKDVRPEVLESKRVTQKKKQPNILGTEQRDWNASTISDQKIQKDPSNDLKGRLLKIRAGVGDHRILKPSKFHTDEQIAERHKFIVSVTGQGPVGKLTGKWFNSVDERGLARHCVNDEWPDWNASHSCHTKDDVKAAQAMNDRKERQRKKHISSGNHMKTLDYVNPAQAVTNVNSLLRERKADFQDLKEEFKRELRVEFPSATEERLQAMAQRLLNEKLTADEKMTRFPVQNESFRPNLSLTTQDRRYKEFHHPGTYVWLECEQRQTWSCCSSFERLSRGCECKVVNPDHWCTLGFERA